MAGRNKAGVIAIFFRKIVVKIFVPTSGYVTYPHGNFVVF